MSRDKQIEEITQYYVLRNKDTGMYFRGKGVNRWGKYFNQATIYRVKGTAEASVREVSWHGEKAEIVPIQIFENDAGYRKASDLAEEIFAEIGKQLARYSHLHRYAEEAREVTEEYADGTPCEMTSVWEVISLHKNGWDDYETMCKLQDNIGNIEKSRLLKEFEGDIAELKKKYTEEGK